MADSKVVVDIAARPATDFFDTKFRELELDSKLQTEVAFKVNLIFKSPIIR